MTEFPEAVSVALGIAGPLMVAIASWTLAERTWRRRPVQLTAVMITAFGAKLIFFAAYVALMLSVFSLRPIPFVASFTTAFIAFHLAEALALRRLFQQSPRP